MRHQKLILPGLAILALMGTPPAVVAQDKQPSAKQKQKKQTEPKTQQSALAGCIDQQDGHYVLIQDQTRSLIARLEAEGFPTEGFAKHLGHKVTVRGTASSSGAESQVFKVRTVEEISDACGPQL